MGINDLDPTEVLNAEMSRATDFLAVINGGTDDAISALNARDGEIESLVSGILRRPGQPFPKPKLVESNKSAVADAFKAMRKFGLEVGKEEAAHVMETLGGGEEGMKPLTSAEIREIVDGVKFLGKSVTEHRTTLRNFRGSLLLDELQTLQQARKAGAIIRGDVEIRALQRGRDALGAIVAAYAQAVREAIRKRFYKRNPGAVGIFYWSSILDSRTSLICQAMNGATRAPGDKLWSNGMAPEYPAHPHERSVILNLPAKAIKSMERMTFASWFDTLPKEQQIKMLGEKRHELYRQGRVSLKDFVTKKGRRLTLDELRRLHPPKGGKKKAA